MIQIGYHNLHTSTEIKYGYNLCLHTLFLVTYVYGTVKRATNTLKLKHSAHNYTTLLTTRKYVPDYVIKQKNRFWLCSKVLININ